MLINTSVTDYTEVVSQTDRRDETGIWLQHR